MDKILAEIRSVKRFWSARKSHANCELDQVRKSFADQLLKLIGKAKLTTWDVAAITEELQADDAGLCPYGEHCTDILDALDKLVVTPLDQNPDDAEAIADTSAGKQMLQHWYAYPTVAEWSIMLDNQKSMHVKMATMVHRARRIGVVGPNEQAVKWLLALIYKCHYTELPLPKQRFRQLCDLKLMFITEAESRPDMICPKSCKNYPDKANKLPSAILSAAYEADEQPLDKSGEMTGLAAIAKLIPLRKSSKLLKGVEWSDDEDDIPKRKRPKREQSTAGAQAEPIPMKIEPLNPVKNEPVTPMADQRFCHTCGHELGAARASPDHVCPNIKAEEPEDEAKIRIRSQLRLNGQHVAVQPAVTTSAPVLKLESLTKEEANTETEPPKLDPYAQAAVDALRSRNDKKVAAAAAAAQAQKSAADAAKKAAGAADVQAGKSGDGDAGKPDDGAPVMKRPAGRKSGAAPIKDPRVKRDPNAKPVFKPTYGIEETRQQVQCRTGLKASEAGGVIAPAFRYKNFPTGKAGAVNAAKKWLADFRKKHKCQ